MALQPLESTHPPRLSLTCGWTIVIVMGALFASATPEASAGETDWRTGTQFQKQLQAQVGLTWQSRGIREGLETLARSQRVAIFLDRRVDPERSVTFSCEDTSLEDAIRGIAGKAKLGVGFVGPVVYVGPPLTCARIATLAEVRNEQVKALPLAAHNRLLKKNISVWPDLVEPRLILARMATTAGIEIPNVQAVPHDLWRSNDLPNLTFAEQATLVTAGFDMAFRWHKNAKQVFLTRFPPAVTLERAYSSAKPEAFADEIEKLLPQAFVEVVDGRVVVRTMLEDHWTIERTRGKRGVPEKGAANRKDKRYTLTVKNEPAGVLLKLFATKLKLELVVHKDVPRAKLDKRISLSVNEVTDVDLFKATARAAGLTAQFDTGKVYILDKKLQ